MSDEVFGKSLGKMSVAIASGALSAQELMDSCLARVAERDFEVKAWTWLNPDQAKAGARVSDQAVNRLSPLHGIPVAIKDLIDTAEMPTSYGSRIYRDHIPSEDAAIVSALKKAGAVIMGKTVTAEFATYTPGETRNPLNTEHTPGGSSSGSAAAVADMQVPFAIGTQTAGSMIRPAAFNGIVGFKPSYGVLPYRGTRTVSPTLDTLGTFSRTVSDQRLIMTALAPQLRISNSIEAPLILACKTPFWDQADSEMQAAFLDYVNRCVAAGYRVETYELGPDFLQLTDAQRDIMAAEGARALSGEYQEKRNQLSPALISLIEDGMQVSSAREAECHNLKARCFYTLHNLFERADYILTPATTGEAPLITVGTGDPVFNRIWTYLGLPVLTFPIGKGQHQLPMGVQVTGPYGCDHALIDFSDKLQAVTL